jgi:hypothetical protein
MTEIDERTLTAPAPAFPRFDGDSSVFSPNYMTPRGFHIGRQVRGIWPCRPEDIWTGALQVFVPGTLPLRECDDLIREYCDHAQVHPAVLHIDGKGMPGRGYWVRSELEALLMLAPKVSAYSALWPVLMTVPDGSDVTECHGRVIVPYDGRVGVSAFSAAQLDAIRECMSNSGARPVLEHLDFNGTHFGTTGPTLAIAETMSALSDAFDTSHIRVAGMSTFTSPRLNIEQYPVREFRSYSHSREVTES